MTPWRVVALVPLGLDGEGDPLGALPAAREVADAAGVPLEALMVGRTLDEAFAARATAAGATRLTLCEHPGLADAPAVETALAACEAALRLAWQPPQPLLVVVPATPGAEELGARLAVRLDGAALGRCARLALEGDRARGVRPAFGGRAEVTLETAAGTCFASLRARPAAGMIASGEGAATVRRTVLDTPLPPCVVPERREPAGGPRPLAGARLVVSGGRGMGGEEGFARLAELAALLDGVVGASLPAVDAGWAAVSQQVGQSGRYVTPDLYLAVGLSGTPQHLAGLGPDTRILAINSDASAEIFRHAEAGLVADWREALPALIDTLRGSP